MNNSLQYPQSPRILIVGNGAREHAIAWSLAKSPRQPVLFAAPGNAGMAEACIRVNIRVDDVEGLIRFAQAESIDLVVVGPELPLSKGLVDACEATGIRAFGPTAAAAALEASKAQAKRWMQRAGVPTAAFGIFEDAEEAKAFVLEQGTPIVVKADGLAAGKGVVVAETVDEALAAIDCMMVDLRYGDSGKRIVVESFLEGKEVSMMFFVDADTVVPMLPARDYKRVADHDEGPNTGGMGAFAPVPGFVSDGHVEVVQDSIVRPILAALRADGIVYRGVLYVGLMMTADGPYVVEFNCRFGDPETQVVLPLLQTDLFDILWAVAHHQLTDVSIRWSDERCVGVVMTALGYPTDVRTGDVIRIPCSPGECRPEARFPKDGSMLFHAGTERTSGDLVTAGGRILVAVGCGHDFESARRIAYQTADDIYFDGKHVRRDIAVFA